MSSLGLLALVAFGLQIPAAHAQLAPPIVVNSTFDGQFAGDTNPGDGNCDCDAGTPGEQCTLRAAIQEADARPGPDTINFDPAVFATPTTIVMSWAPLANANGTTLTIDGGMNKVTITSSLVGVRQFALGNGTGPGGNLTLNNLSINNGGGILVSKFWTLTVNNALFADNIGQGAGIDNNGTLTVNNSTFSANLGALPGTTGHDGGAIRNGGTATVLNCFIVGNTGGRGGAIFNHPDGTISLGNSYVGHNPTAATRPVFGTVTSLGYNGFNEIPNDIIGDLTGNLAVTHLDQYYPLADNGGPTRTHALTPTSDLLDKGTSRFAPAFDQRGFPRPYDDLAIPNAPGGDGSDIGPFETQALTVDANPPVAGADLLTRPGTARVVKVLKSALLANDSDADLDPLTITAVGNALPVGATVVISGNFVIYAAPTAAAGSGSFTYTVSDGVSSVTGTVNVTVAEPETPTQNVTSTLLTGPVGSEQMQVGAAGIPGRRYVLQITDDLASPITWTDLGPTQVAPANGHLQFNDPLPDSPRFYRVIEQ